MKGTMVLLTILFVLLAYRAPVFAMGGDHPPGPVHAQNGWPEGLVELLNRGERIHGIWVNANDFFYFAGDTDAFNECLEQYAVLKNTPLRLILHPGMGMTGSLGDEKNIPFEWEISVMRWHDDPSGVPTLVTMELWLGGLVQLDKIRVPLNVEVKAGREIAKFIAEHKSKRKTATPPLAARCNAIKWEVPAGSSDSYPAGLREIQKELISSGREVLPEIEASLEESLNLRRIAAKIVAEWPNDKTRAILSRLSKDEDSAVASQAVYYLGETGGKEVQPYLLDAIKHADANVRHTALNALSRNGLGGAVEYLAAAACLYDAAPFARESAVSLMAETRETRLIENAIKHLRNIATDDKDERVRQAANKAIRVLDARKSAAQLSDRGKAHHDELPPVKLRQKDGMKMRLIPTGEFSMGDGEGRKDEKPVHTVHLDAYWMDETEVTNEQYCTFLNDYGKNTDAAGHQLIDLSDDSCLIEKAGDTYKPKPGYEKHPVVEVGWHGAAAYAQWAGARLPTEAQWEKAARGGLVGKKYPLGDAIIHDDANYSTSGGWGGRKHWWGGTTLVGSYPANGYGLYDMAGNVSEWCAEEYDENYYGDSPPNNPPGPGTPILFADDDFAKVKATSERVFRGGSWNNGQYRVRCAQRVGYGTVNSNPYLGFRCVVVE